MCGITGFISSANIQHHINLQRMTDSLIHRGPDDSGMDLFESYGHMIGMGHRRLSILELSRFGHQPMQSYSGRYTIVYNGEIYNFLEIRKELDFFPCHFKGRSDTEVLLAAIDIWGLESALQKTIGMFALALWDHKDRKLSLACDRMGEKPLYYGWQDNSFLFSSELKAMEKHSDFKGAVDHNVLSLFIRHGYITAPYSIYKDIYKLEPGRIFSIDIGTSEARRVPLKETENNYSYWDIKGSFWGGNQDCFTGNLKEATQKLDKLLNDSVTKQMISDVPLGAFLSGGIDSSTIVSIMQANSSSKIKTFTIGFYEKEYNEAQKAKSIAQYLGTDHTEMYVTSKETMDVIPRLSRIYDEPFADASQIPSFLISQLSRKQVKVVLSGDGGDELFGGYKRYTFGEDVWNKASKIPLPFRSILALGLKKLPNVFFNSFDWMGQSIFERYGSKGSLFDKVLKAVNVVNSSNENQFYKKFISSWQDPDKIIINSNEVDTIFNHPEKWPKHNSFAQRMMAVDLITYLPGDILTKVDRAAMSVSLETRIPLLDHRIVEFAMSLPISMKRQNGQGKIILKELLYKYIPQKIVDYPKMGFGVPVGSWLKGPLFDWANELLDEKTLKNDGFLNSELVSQIWGEHISSKRDWTYVLWNIIMFQAWLMDHH